MANTCSHYVAWLITVQVLISSNGLVATVCKFILHMIISGNLAVAMSTCKKTSTTKSSRQGSSSHQQLPVHIPMVMLKWPVATLHYNLCTCLTILKCSCYYHTTRLPCQCCSESAPKCNLKISVFKIFLGHAPDHSNISIQSMLCTTITKIWKSL